jgi:hypothetical protein
MMEAIPGRHGCYGYSGSMDVIKIFRRTGEARFTDRYEFGVRAQPSHRAHDAIANTEARGSGANSIDNTRHFGAQYYWQWKREGISHIAFADLPIDAVHAGGSNSNQNLALPWFWLFDLGHLRGVSAAVCPDQYNALNSAHCSSSYRVSMTRR